MEYRKLLTEADFSNDVDKSLEMINKYLNTVIRACFKKEGRPYDPRQFCIKYVIVETPDGDRVLSPLHLWCKYGRIESDFKRRLAKYLYDTTSIYYSRINDVNKWFVLDKHIGQVDINFSEASFIVHNDQLNKSKQVNLSIFSHTYDDLPAGECIKSARYEKLLFEYRGFTAEDYRRIKAADPNDSRLHLPDVFRYDWNRFYRLFVKTFGTEPGNGYKFICGPGVEKVEVPADGKES